MNLRKIKKEFKTYDGGSLKFRDQHHPKTYYFEMNYQSFLPIYKGLSSHKKDRLYLLSSKGHHTYLSKEELEDKFKQTVLPNQLIRRGTKAYGICDYDYMIELLKNMGCPEKDYPQDDISVSYEINISTSYLNQSKNRNKPSSIFSKAVKKKTPTFDWAEAYEEGLRIFEDDEDQAEAYADEMKYKKTGRL